jgi:hypothetical protein
LNRHIGQGRRGFPEAHEPLAGKERAGTGIRDSHSERGSRPGATTKQEDQRGRAGSRSERNEEATSTHHRDPGAGLSRPCGQFAPRNIHLLASYDLSHLFNLRARTSGAGYARRFASNHRVTVPEGEDDGLPDRCRSEDEQHPGRPPRASRAPRRVAGVGVA